MSKIAKDNFLKKDDPKYIDLLDEDMPVSGQKFVCLSFVEYSSFKAIIVLGDLIFLLT